MECDYGVWNKKLKDENTQETNKQKEAPKKCIFHHQSYMDAQETPVTSQSCPHVHKAGPQVTAPSPSGTSQSVAGLCSTQYRNSTPPVPVKCMKARVTHEHY